MDVAERIRVLIVRVAAVREVVGRIFGGGLMFGLVVWGCLLVLARKRILEWDREERWSKPSV